MDIIKEAFIRFDKIISKLFLERHFFESEEKKNKQINELKAFLSLNKIEDTNTQKVLDEVSDFTFNAEIIETESLFSKLCSLAPKVPIEYWNLKTTETISPKPIFYRETVFGDYTEMNKDQ